MDLDRYLARIGYSGPRTPSHQGLRQLHRAHLFSIPFENLSIGWGEPIELSDVAHYWKIVECRRGGFCYEQNGLFAWALRELGYTVTLLGASVWQQSPVPGFGPELGHLLLRVDVDQPLLVDVGFGDSFINPIVLRIDAVHEEPFARAYRVVEDGGLFTLEMREGAGEFVPRYRFALTPRTIDEFEAMCVYQQTSPQSFFTRRQVVTLARPDGRLTLVDRTLTETGADGSRQHRDLRDEREWAQVLEQFFGIVAPRA